MEINPNTSIYLLRGIPLDNTYNDTLYFATASAQLAYFQGKLSNNGGVSFTKQTYQRVGRNRCRLEISADKIYNVNYMFFQNTAYGSKWFYAFVTNVEYINDAVSEISYEIDVIQTYMFDWKLGMSFIDREHAATDAAGDNLMSEPFDVGDYVVESWETDPWITEDDLTIPGITGTVLGGYVVMICSAEQVGV